MLRPVAIVASIVIHVGLVTTAVRVGLPIVDLRPEVIAAELTPPDPVAPPPPPPRKVEPPAPRVVPPRPKPVPVETLPKVIEAPPPKIEEPKVVEAPPAPPPPSPSVVARSAEPPAAPTVALPQSSPPPPSQSSASAGVSMVTSESVPARSSAPPAPPGPTAAITPDAVTRVAIPRGGYQVRPSYPSSARRLGVEGTTLLRVHVGSDGRVGDVLVETSAGHNDLDQAAVDAVRRWRFEPARRGDDPVAMWVRLPVEFRMR